VIKLSNQKWERYFLDIAKTVSTMATCPRLHVGAVIVKDRNILATGYNGSAAGFPHCDDVGCKLVENHCIATVHAEVNAILQAAKNGASLKHSHIYVTHSPCINCLKCIINAGISSITYDQVYKTHPAELLEQLGSRKLIVGNTIFL
jgi:dCMP deaminase